MALYGVSAQSRGKDSEEKQSTSSGSKEMPMVAATNGRTLPADVVVAHCLRYVKALILDKLKKANWEVDKASVLWCLTVPAIWNPKAKAVMRAAAEQAGMTTNGHQMLLA